MLHVPWPRSSNPAPGLKDKPVFPAGAWILLENPDANEGVDDNDISSTGPSGYKVNKLPVSWDYPYGTCDDDETIGSIAYLNFKTCMGISVSEFCTDCHDGNAGLHTQVAPMFSEDRALRGESNVYDIGYSHDAQPRH